MNEKKEAQKASYNWYKEHGICVKCRQADARPGRVQCEACAETNRQLMRKRWQNQTLEQKEKSAAAHKKWYERRKANGVCVECGKAPAESGRVFCDTCLAKHRKEKPNVTK